MKKGEGEAGIHKGGPLVPGGATTGTKESLAPGVG
jgi:hypothetical protein